MGVDCFSRESPPRFRPMVRKSQRQVERNQNFCLLPGRHVKCAFDECQRDRTAALSPSPGVYHSRRPRPAILGLRQQWLDLMSGALANSVVLSALDNDFSGEELGAWETFL